MSVAKTTSLVSPKANQNMNHALVYYLRRYIGRPTGRCDTIPSAPKNERRNVTPMVIFSRWICLECSRSVPSTSNWCSRTAKCIDWISYFTSVGRCSSQFLDARKHGTYYLSNSRIRGRFRQLLVMKALSRGCLDFAQQC